MNASDFPLDELLCFLRVAQAGSLAKAATRLAVTPSALSKRLARMESALGVALVQRSSRALRLTQAGSRLVAQASPLVQQLENVAGDLLAEAKPAQGLVRFSASGSFGKLVLVPLVARYLLEHPEVRIDMDLSERKVAIAREGFDFAVRIGGVPEAGLRARRIGSVRRVLCAAPAYAATHGLPRTPEELAAHACLVQSKSAASLVLQGASRSVTARLPARLMSGPSDILMQPVQMGVGIAALPEIQVAGLLRRGELMRVLPGWEMPAAEVRIVYPAQRRLPPATRSLMAYLAAQVPPQIERLLSSDAEAPSPVSFPASEASEKMRGAVGRAFPFVPAPDS